MKGKAMQGGGPYTLGQKSLAWSVHALTSSGVIAAFLAILAIHEHEWRLSMIWLLVAFFIDGIDGFFARLFKVKEVLPFFDGKNIDYVIDFATYAIIPAFFLYECGILSDSLRFPAIVSMLMVSAYYYGKSGMVSDDLYFIGFPVLWNLVAFYLYFVFSWSPLVNFTSIIILSILHVIPLKYIYPSRTPRFRALNVTVAIIEVSVIGMIVYLYPQKNSWLSLIAIAAVIYFFAITIISSFFTKEHN